MKYTPHDIVGSPHPTTGPLVFGPFTFKDWVEVERARIIRAVARGPHVIAAWSDVEIEVGSQPEVAMALQDLAGAVEWIDEDEAERATGHRGVFTGERYVLRLLPWCPDILEIYEDSDVYTALEQARIVRAFPPDRMLENAEFHRRLGGTANLDRALELLKRDGVVESVDGGFVLNPAAGHSPTPREGTA
jgi:hypothetical protein